MSIGQYKKKERFRKVDCERIKIFLKKKKTKSVNTLANDLEMPLKNVKMKNVSIVVNAIKIFLKIKNKG